MWFAPIRLHDEGDARSAYYWAGVSASRKARGALAAYLQLLAGSRPEQPAMLLHVSHAFRMAARDAELENQLQSLGKIRLGKARVVSTGFGELADEELRDFVVWLEIRAATQVGPILLLCAMTLIDGRWQLIGLSIKETA